MAASPRLLVLTAKSSTEHCSSPELGVPLETAPDPDPNAAPAYQTVVATDMARAICLLREQEFAGIYIDRSYQGAFSWTGLMLQAEAVLESLAEGVAVIASSRRLVWVNSAFSALVGSSESVRTGQDLYVSLSQTDPPEPDPFALAWQGRRSASVTLSLPNQRYLALTLSPVFSEAGGLTHLIALTRETTGQVLQAQKLEAIHRAGEELAGLTADDLREFSEAERTEWLADRILDHMRNLLGFDYVEIRLLDPETLRLMPLISEGMTARAVTRVLYAKAEGNGVTGMVAETGRSYLCRDTAGDPTYLEGAEGAGSSLTVPLLYQGQVIGTINVESRTTDQFDERDRQFLEIYARSMASALNVLDLLRAERRQVSSDVILAVRRELALPLDDIVTDATTVLARYAGHDEDIVARLKKVLYRARQIRQQITHFDRTQQPEPHEPGQPDDRPTPLQRLRGVRILLADADVEIRRAAHNQLEDFGAVVETVRDATEAIALAQQSPYDAALIDIRLPDFNGYEAYTRLRAVQPKMAIVLMTGFGYDPTHSIVKAKREGLEATLYKPFKTELLLKTVEQVTIGMNSKGEVPETAVDPSSPKKTKPVDGPTSRQLKPADASPNGPFDPPVERHGRLEPDGLDCQTEPDVPDHHPDPDPDSEPSGAG